MRAIMLAAGMGLRLSGGEQDAPPKALLRFGGRSLLDRHVEILRRAGVNGLTLVVGHRREAIEAELAAIGAGAFVTIVHNPDYRYGSLVSLWAAREDLARGGDILFMDADVLYDRRLIERLVAAKGRNCFLLDRDFEPGDEPVKLCLSGGRIVEFRKRVEVAHDVAGEWPGFAAFDARTAAELAAVLQDFVERSRLDDPYEEAMRRIMLARPQDFAVADITGMPWIEIDFVEDVERARRLVLPLVDGGAQTRKT